MPGTIETTLAPAPPATPAAPPANPGSAVPSSKGEIHVVPQPVAPAEAPKPGTTRSKVFDDLRKKAKNPGVSDEPAARTSEKPASAPSKPEGATEPGSGSEPTEPTPLPGTAPADDKGKKVSPWKLVDEWKGKYASLEKQLSELKTGTVSPEDKVKFDERITKAETRAKELEDHIRFVDYSKSEEFKTKFVDPYEKAWSRAMSELNEITIEDGNGGSRPVAPQDMLDLVNLPLGKAREIADNVFGAFANDVMEHRKEIKRLFEAQNEALDEAKKNGTERIKQAQETTQKQIAELHKQVTANWTKENEAITKDEKVGKYFTPVEGDEQGNQRLAKGFELVDKAFSENPLDPKLTPEQRAAVVKRHAAVRNRAAGWGRLRYQNEQLEAKLAALEKELGEYKTGEPPTAGRAPKPGTVQLGARESLFGELRKRAK